MSDGPNDHHRPFLSMGTFADTNTVKPTAKVITVDTPQALGDAIAIGRNNATAAAMTNGANWIMAMKIDDDRPMCDLTANVRAHRRATAIVTRGPTLHARPSGAWG